MRLLAQFLVGVLLLAGTPVMPLTVRPAAPSAPGPAPATPRHITALVYVYEKDDGPVPPALITAFDRVNREKKIPATLFEDDTVDGSGKTPEQYRVPLEAARAVSLPALVVMSGTAAAKTVKSPKTSDDVLKVFQ